MGRRFVFSTSTELLRVPPETLVYISADGNYSVVVTADGERLLLTMQLGQMERRIADMADSSEHRFIRIGKSLIVNRDYIALINPVRQRLILSDCRTFRHEVSASKEALKALKDLLEKEAIQ